jgi:nitrogen regulatory protein PII
MANLVEAQLITVVADTVIERTILDAFLKMGVKGYTCVYCFGKGRHAAIEDPYSGKSRVRIEMVVPDAIVAKIMDYLHSPQINHYAVIEYVQTIKIDSRDHFH